VIALGPQGAGLPAGLHPLMNMGERATLFCFAFLYIATRGAGIWSVDAAMRGPSARPMAA
jgi:putative oxidoreductase